LHDPASSPAKVAPRFPAAQRTKTLAGRE